MSNSKISNKRIFAIVIVLTLLLSMIGCSIDISQGIIGKWYCINDSSVMEVKSDGKLVFTSFQDNSDNGEYTFKDKLLYFQTGSAANNNAFYENGIYSVSLSNTNLTLKPVSSGETIDFVKYGVMNDRIVGKWRFKDGGEGFFEYDNNEEPPTGVELEFSSDNSFTCTAENFENAGSGRFCFEDNKTIVVMFKSNRGRSLIFEFQIDQVDDNKLVLEERGVKLELDKE